jgi:putative DNA primase/helicase
LEKPKLEHTIDAIGSSLLEAYHIKTLKDTKEMLFYSKNGFYEPHAEEIIEQTVRQQVDRNISKHELSEILYYIQTMSYTERSEFDKDPAWLHVGNGWVNTETREFVEHSQDRLSFYKIPWDYDVNATYLEHLTFFSQVFEEEDLDAVQKMYGYFLLPDNRYKKAFVLVGPKDSGKSVTLSDIEAFAGRPSHVSLHDMAAFNHNVAAITKSTVNTTSELPKYKLKDVSLFKAITGNDERTFREIYGKPFECKVRAKFVMAANELPDFEGMDQTFIDRWIVFRFSNVFKRGEDMDVKILDKLVTSSEMSGLLNYALDGLLKLVKDGYFKEQDYNELKATWDQVNSKIGEYVESHCEHKEQAFTPAAQLFNDYQEKGGKLSKAMFGREVKKLGWVKHNQIRILGKPVYVYEGIAIKGQDAVIGVIGNLGTVAVENEILGEDKSQFPIAAITEIIYCPNGCNRAFSTKEQVAEHCKIFHTEAVV